MFKKILAGLVTAVLSLGVVALVAGPASAHHNTISAKVACATDGTYKVTWSVTNSESGKTEVITVSNNTALVPVGTSFNFSETRAFVQSVNAPADITLALTGFWDGDTSTSNDDVYSANSGSIWKNAFPTGCLKVTADAWEHPSVCNGPNTYTVPQYEMDDVAGVKYTVNGVPQAAGVLHDTTNGTTVNIAATVTESRYQLVGTTTWSFTFTAPADPCTEIVIPEQPDFKQPVCSADPGEHSPARYYMPSTTGVIYSVKLNGVESNSPADTSEGWHNVPDSVTTIQVIARGDTAHYYVVLGGSVIFDLWTIVPVGECLKEIPPKTPVVAQATCLGVDHPGGATEASYTLVPVEHIVYMVSTDNGATYKPASGKIVVTSFPAHVIVHATVDDDTKYQAAAYEEIIDFTDPGDCKVIITPISPDPTHQYCDDSKQPRVLIDGTVTIHAADHVTYYLDGIEKAPGTYVVAPGDHVVTISYDDKLYKLDANAHMFPFKFTINPGECLVTHPLVTPLVVSSQIGCFNAGSYTLSNSKSDANAVIWTVNTSQVAQGKYTVATPGTVTITAAPNSPDYGFDAGVQTSWTVDFKKPAVCDVETLAMTGQSPTGLLIAADLLVVAGLAMFAMRAVRRGRSQTA